jgi:hypothetical protein
LFEKLQPLSVCVFAGGLTEDLSIHVGQCGVII